MRKSNRPNSAGSTQNGRMQRIVSQATARLSSDTMYSDHSEYHDNGHNGLVRYRLQSPMTSIAISPEKEAVAVAGRDGKIQIKDFYFIKGKENRTLAYTYILVFCILYSFKDLGSQFESGTRSIKLTCW